MLAGNWRVQLYCRTMRTTFVVTETYTIEATTIQEAEAAVRSDNFSVDNNLQNHKITIGPNN